MWWRIVYTLYVNNIILFILIVHNTVYFFTSCGSTRTRKKNQHNKNSRTLKKKKRNQWRNVSRLANWSNRQGLFLSSLNGVTTFLEQRHLLYKMKFPLLHWWEAKGNDRSLWSLWSKLLSPQSLHLSVSVLCFLSCSLMDSNVLPCLRDQCEVVVLFNSHSLAHMHVRFAKVLSQLHQSITTCRNTCTSVQQWSINDNSNNKNKCFKSKFFLSVFNGCCSFF